MDLATSLVVLGLMTCSYVVGCWAGFKAAEQQFNAAFTRMALAAAKERVKDLRPRGEE